MAAASETVLRVFQLWWQPGEQMHGDWWQRLELYGWQAKYTQLSLGARRELDRLICQRRAFPKPMDSAEFAELSPLQQALLRAGQRMPMLLLAMGLLLLDCPDYLLWRPYRETLSCWLSEAQLEQLQVLWRNGQLSPQLPPELLVHEAQMSAQAALDRLLWADPVWQAVRYTLPATDARQGSARAVTAGEHLFIRLEHFL
ncbi:hypothetical protein MUA02_01180 [Enterobacteriaceae bacterium H20N1]|uniref:Uncharacterized protein n=1 Tax=Dryocola boscaweniae TaxID=2925397 RepID=A0A9X3AP36_9ENTR|nr:type III secretion system domain-containing protein [Dryocola boscaweniae]MCT4700520.1 hypothetical protein [Dryocola boscaweniae]MCT4717676.1 hypothetical protein [Dryocola boscaweniae]